MLALLLVVIAVGAVVYGHYFLMRIALWQAASEGARAAQMATSDTDRNTAALAAVDSATNSYGAFLPASAVTRDASPAPDNSNLFQVSITVDLSSLGYGGFGPYLQPLLPSSLTVTAVAARNGT